MNKKKINVEEGNNNNNNNERIRHSGSQIKKNK